MVLERYGLALCLLDVSEHGGTIVVLQRYVLGTLSYFGFELNFQFYFQNDSFYEGGKTEVN